MEKSLVKQVKVKVKEKLLKAYFVGGVEKSLIEQVREIVDCVYFVGGFKKSKRESESDDFIRGEQ